MVSIKLRFKVYELCAGETATVTADANNYIPVFILCQIKISRHMTAILTGSTGYTESSPFSYILNVINF